ncbi:ribonuclease E inhibitor RraB [Solimicrobium silvestre]|uniref:Regulator of ribonuclease activity B domain-containing protein n=1 Tax=Solimicrobium silvestre TaxID=2099400 RepID=A0A2S9H0M6_9BURK|nr:ribonuclease E inhibitor RraB [Solimicrobium silvestre]PRC93500.1 hypothetical protein S2091_1887 [Solimicrobium silvestre]
MGIFKFFSNEPKKFVPRESFVEITNRQLTMTPQTLMQLRKYNVTPEKELKLEFFFYTNTSAKADALATALLNRSYQVNHGPSASDKNIQIITGWTAKFPMNDSSVLEWTKDMCELGFEHDCEFDGWGTNPEQ